MIFPKDTIIFLCVCLVVLYVVLKKIISIYKQYYTCTKCGQSHALEFVSSEKNNRSLEQLVPNNFQSRHYQVVYKCKYCGGISIKIRTIGKNRNGQIL